METLNKVVFVYLFNKIEEEDQYKISLKKHYPLIEKTTLKTRQKTHKSNNKTRLIKFYKI